MRLLEGLAELVAPTRCAGCELPGSLLCPGCLDAVPYLRPGDACARCAAPFGALVCTECWNREFAFSEAIAVGPFEGPLARAVALHKDAGERRLGGLLGGMLARQVRPWNGWPDAVTWIPPTRAAMRRRGFDHAFAFAQPVAEALGVEAIPLLTRGAARDQRALGRGERARNVRGSVSADGQAPSRVVLVDDVMTTGATLDEAANQLLSAGAFEVRVAVVARTW